MNIEKSLKRGRVAKSCHRSVWPTAVDSTRAVSVRNAVVLRLKASNNTEDSGMADLEGICCGVLQSVVSVDWGQYGSANELK